MKLKIGNKKRMERYRANLGVAEKYPGYQKEQFKHVLRDYAINEIVIPKFTALMYK